MQLDALSQELLDRILGFLTFHDLLVFETTSSKIWKTPWTHAWMTMFQRHFKDVLVSHVIVPDAPLKKIFHFRHDINEKWMGIKPSHVKSWVFKEYITALSLSGTENYREFCKPSIAVSAQRSRTMTMWDLSTPYELGVNNKSLIHATIELDHIVRSISVAGCIGDSTIITGSTDGGVRLWTQHDFGNSNKRKYSMQESSIKEQAVLRGHGDRSVIEISAQWNMGRVASSGTDKQVILWDIRSFQQVAKVTFALPVVKLCPLDENCFAIGTYGGLLFQWDIRTRSPNVVHEFEEKQVVTLCHDTSRTAVLLGSGEIAIYDSRMNKVQIQKKILNSLPGPKYIYIDSKKVLVADGESCSVWDAEITRELLPLRVPGFSDKEKLTNPHTLSVSSSVAIGASSSGTITLWDFDSETAMHYEDHFRQKRPVLMPRIHKETDSIIESPKMEQEGVILFSPTETSSPSRDQEGVILF